MTSLSSLKVWSDHICDDHEFLEPTKVTGRIGMGVTIRCTHFLVVTRLGRCCDLKAMSLRVQNVPNIVALTATGGDIEAESMGYCVSAQSNLGSIKVKKGIKKGCQLQAEKEIFVGAVGSKCILITRSEVTVDEVTGDSIEIMAGGDVVIKKIHDAVREIFIKRPDSGKMCIEGCCYDRNFGSQELAKHRKRGSAI